ncbi:YlxR family protein [Ornithinimicrobium avium]|uniref:YlxR family protein n=1 Tax=Ornithinimicrobium avium TaxID=2283195 RepID=UPI001D196311|nr:YlxR family protein [Ornithinimicrobium avium]
MGCRRRDEQTALLRVVAVRDGTTPGWTLVPDERRRAPGRGAYVHRDPECLRTAIARRAFGRALRLPAGSGTDPADVQELVGQQA